jgi:1,4-dihydroxy-2-naphthoyl-CoA hydrolase
MSSSDRDPSHNPEGAAPLEPSEPSDPPDRRAELLAQQAALRAGWIEPLGLTWLELGAKAVVVEWTVSERQHQPHGIVHGGVYTTVVETCCSVGAFLAAPAGKVVVGVENHTSFLRPVRVGRLRAEARPLHAGARAQLWECNIADAEGRLIATGRLRVLAVESAAARER